MLADSRAEGGKAAESFLRRKGGAGFALSAGAAAKASRSEPPGTMPWALDWMLHATRNCRAWRWSFCTTRSLQGSGCLAAEESLGLGSLGWSRCDIWAASGVAAQDGRCAQQGRQAEKVQALLFSVEKTGATASICKPCRTVFIDPFLTKRYNFPEQSLCKCHIDSLSKVGII